MIMASTIAPKLVALALAASALAGVSFAATPAEWQNALAAGRLAYQEGRYVQAERHLRTAAQAAEIFGPNDPRLATTLNELGLVYRTERKYGKAEAVFKRAAGIWEKTPGREHIYAATALNNLAVLYHAQHRDAEAETFFKRALSIEQQTLGPEHPQVATGLTNLAVLHYDRGEYRQAASLYERALTIDEHALGLSHPDLIAILEDYAKVLRKLDRTAEAAKLEARAKAIRAGGR